MLLKTGERLADERGFSEIGDGIGKRIAILQSEEWFQFMPAQLVHTGRDIMGKDKIEKHLLLAGEMRADLDLRFDRPLFAREWRKRIRDVRQHVEQIALLGINQLLHRRQRF